MDAILNPLTHLKIPFENIEHLIPPKVLYLTIFNPELCSNDSEEGLMEQVVCYISNPAVDNGVKLRQIGLIQGMMSFAKDFSQGEDIETIDTEKTRIVVQEFDGYYIAACIELTKLVDSDGSGNDEEGDRSPAEDAKNGTTTEYTTANLSPSAVLCQDIQTAYRLFKLHFGAFDFVAAKSVSFLRSVATPWWAKFAEAWDLSMNNKGFLSTLRGYKLSSKSISYSNSSNIKNVNSISEKLSDFFQSNSSKLIDMVIYNPLDISASVGSSSGSSSGSSTNNEAIARKIVEEYGIIFKGYDIVSTDSLIDIYHWLEQSNFAGLDPLSLIDTSYPVKKPLELEEDGNVIFDPFSTTFNTLSSFFVSEIAPEVPQIDALEAWKQYTAESEKQQGRYLIGMNDKPSVSSQTSPNPDKILHSPWNNKDIFNKSVYVQLEDKEDGELMECRLVVYEIGKLLFVLVFESDYEDLNDMSFYEQLEEHIVDLHDAVTKYFYHETGAVSVTKPKANASSEPVESTYLDRISKSLVLPFGMFFSTSEETTKKHPDEYLRSHIQEDQLKLEKYKQSFYYIVHTPELGFYQTSLPLIPKPESEGNLSGSQNLADSFLDPKYLYDLSVSRNQSLHLHLQLCTQFNSHLLQSTSEKMVNTDKSWWAYFSRVAGSSQRNLYEDNNYDREIFVLKKFGGLRKSKNLLFTDKSNDFMSMMGTNIKVWFENCVSTGRV